MTGFHLPVRVMYWPPTVDEVSEPRTIGLVNIPEMVGLWPRASCMYCPRKTAVAHIMTPSPTDPIHASVMVPLRHTFSRTIGPPAPRTPHPDDARRPKW